MSKQKMNNKVPTARIRNLTSEDLKSVFLEIDLYREQSEFERTKKRLGVAPGKRLLIKWK